MKKDDYILLIYKSLKGELSSDEQDSLTNWLKQSKDNQDLQKEIAKNWKLSSQYEPKIEVDTKAEFEPLRARIRQAKATENGDAKIVPMQSRRRWLSIAAAAAILIIAGLWWINQPTNNENLIVFSSSNGEQKNLTLPDGTVAFINENSRLSYPSVFENQTRTIQFSGEGYFEVAKNPSKPFIIETTDAKVEVLGTEFNLRAYPSEGKTDILVAEGKVKFQEKVEGNSIVLIANQQGVLTSGNLKKVDNPKSNAYAWKSGVLSYKDTPLKEILQDLERIFKVKTTLEKATMEACTLSGRFPDAKPKAILEYAATFLKMELIQVNDQEFRLMGGICE